MKHISGLAPQLSELSLHLVGFIRGKRSKNTIDVLLQKIEKRHDVVVETLKLRQLLVHDDIIIIQEFKSLHELKNVDANKLP